MGWRRLDSDGGMAREGRSVFFFWINMIDFAIGCSSSLMGDGLMDCGHLRELRWGCFMFGNSFSGCVTRSWVMWMDLPWVRAG